MTDLESLNNETLAAIIISYRVLGLNKDKAKNAMKIILKRNENGENFDYNSYIKNNMAKIPKPYLEKSQKETFKKILNFTLNQE